MVDFIIVNKIHKIYFLMCDTLEKTSIDDDVQISTSCEQQILADKLAAKRHNHQQPMDKSASGDPISDFEIYSVGNHVN